MDNSIARLVRFLNAHSVSDAETFRGMLPDGRLVVACMAVHSETGWSGEVLEVIQPTLKACRDWLGY